MKNLPVPNFEHNSWYPIAVKLSPSAKHLKFMKIKQQNVTNNSKYLNSLEQKIK